MTKRGFSGTGSSVFLNAETRQLVAAMAREKLQQVQLDRLNKALQAILPQNRFYQAKLGDTLSTQPGWQSRPLSSLAEFAELPFTTKSELVDAATSFQPPNLTYPLAEYTRLHRTSGTSGKPLPVLDTPADWRWWMAAWQFVLDAAEITAADRIVSAFNFGPFIGFWSAHDAAATRGALVVPSGGMNTVARLELLAEVEATVIFCTPTYALRLAEVAAGTGFNLASLPVRVLVVAGEPGGSIPVIRERIETAFNARVVDHSGASEVGPWGYANPERTGLLINEFDFIAEFLPLPSEDDGTAEKSATTSQPTRYELVLTNLGRLGCPVLRYRTGDVVVPEVPDYGFTLLKNGILGRADDMLIVRGVNIFPSSLEAILREFQQVIEYRITARKVGALDDLVVEIEPSSELAESGTNQLIQEVSTALQVRLGLRVEVTAVQPGSLPRFEVKGRRFVDAR